MSENMTENTSDKHELMMLGLQRAALLQRADPRFTDAKLRGVIEKILGLASCAKYDKAILVLRRLIEEAQLAELEKDETR